MAYQTTYASSPAMGIVGMSADQSPKVKVSRVVSVAAILPGAVAMVGATYNTVRPYYTGGVYAGIWLMTSNTSSDYIDTAQIGKVISIMKKGCIWVNAFDVATPGGPVYYRTADGLYTSTAANGILIANAVFETGITSGPSICKLRLL